MYKNWNNKFKVGLAFAVIFSLLIASLALADGISGDADALALAAPHANLVTATQNGGTAVAYDFSAYIKNTGNAANDVFRSGHPEDSVSVGITRSGDWEDGGTPGSFTFTAYDAAQAGKIKITVPCGQQGTTKTMTVALKASANNGQNLSPDSITLSYIITAGPDDASCSPADTTMPTASPTQSPAANGSGWNNSDVTVDWNWADNAGGSGIDSAHCTTSSSSSVEGTITLTATCKDLAGNEGSASYTVKVDKTKPQLSTCDSPDSAWHADDVTLKCTYTDGGSGPASQQISLFTNVAAGTETNNAIASAGGAQACDIAGNCADSPADIGGNMVDKEAPVVTCGSADGLWHATDVSIACTATDGGSDLANAGDASFTLSTNVGAGTETDSAYTDSKSVSDAVGNSATAGPVGPFKIDKKAPVVNCGAADSIWHAIDQSVSCTATDGGSGPASQTVTLSTNVAAGDETASAFTNSQDVSDNVGNKSTAGPVGPFRIDKKVPVVSCGSADSIWHATDQSVTCTATDGGSGLANAGDASFTLSTNVGAGTETDSAYTDSKSVLDAVGNSATAGPVGPFKIDKKAPVVSCGAADSTWHGTDHSVTCTATDGGSGPASQTVTLSTSVAAGTETNNAYTDSKSVSDAVGNSATAGPVGPFKIDKKAPTITISSPTATIYILNQAVAADYSCTDGGSGVASCAGPVANGNNIDTNSVGSKIFTVNAADNVGNSSSQTVSYSVIYDFKGFFQPVDNLPVYNKVKAGQAIPIKFSLSGYQGLVIFAEGYPKSGVIACTAGTTDTIESTVTAGNSSLSYDPVADQYVYVWKTDKTWANTCRGLVVKLIDGTEHTVNFTFTK